MILEEAIEMYVSNAEHERTHGNLQECMDFKQLAEWLKELKQYREWLESFNPDSATDCFTAVRELKRRVKV